MKIRPRLVIAGTGSGVGKTTVTLGLMAALSRRKRTVQGFKVGPDYLDPSYHTAITGRPSRNLDTWMMEPDRMREVFLRGSDGADLSVIEGVMGLYDGKDSRSDEGSAADIAVRLKCPVILVIAIDNMARSAAAVVMGFMQLNREVQIAGVVVNGAGSEGHYRLVKAAIEQTCRIPVVGWLSRDESLRIPERHLGLIPAVERGELHPLFDALADAIEKTVDLDRIEALAHPAPSLETPASRLFAAAVKEKGPRPLIAVARDAAFNFYYPENLELLTQMGADLLMFRPLDGEEVPAEADGLMIGGGFPEEFLQRLAQAEGVKASFRKHIKNGLPTYAECGGYMYLCNEIRTQTGEAYPMVGVIPAAVQMKSHLVALGYRQVRALRDTILLKKGETARGHEYHYSALCRPAFETPYESEGGWGRAREGYATENLLASYTHLHFASNPSMVRRWIDICRQYRVKRA